MGFEVSVGSVDVLDIREGEASDGDLELRRFGN